MIWICLGVLAVLMAAPFVLSWYYTGKKKRSILSIPNETSDIPFRHAVTENPKTETHKELIAPTESVYENPLYIEGNASFGEKCELLASTECDGDMELSDGSSFYDLFARRIRFLGGAEVSIPDSNAFQVLTGAKKSYKVTRNISRVNDQEVIEKTIVTRRGLHVGKNAVIKGDIQSVIGIELDEGASIGGNIISHRVLSVGKNCTVLGDVSTEQDIELEDGVTIWGNVISQKNIKIGSGCHIKGNAFAQERIEIYENVTVGTEDHIKSVVAGDAISIRGNSTVYGRVRANRGGKLEKMQPL